MYGGGARAKLQDECELHDVGSFHFGLPSINTPVNTKCFLCPEFEAQNPYGPLEDIANIQSLKSESLEVKSCVKLGETKIESTTGALQLHCSDSVLVKLQPQLRSR